MSNINTQDVAKAEEALKGAFENLIVFGKLFLDKDFLKSQPTPIFHEEVARELISSSNKPCAFILPRESGKTILTKACIIRDFCFAKKAVEWGFAKEERNLFYGWCADTQKKSINNVNYIRHHFKRNKKLLYYFGREGLISLIGYKDTQESIVTIYDDTLISSSNLSSMRGDSAVTEGEGAVRYGKVFADDSENENNTITDLSRDRIVDNILNGILPNIRKDQNGFFLVFSNTPVHYASYTQRILEGWIKAVKEEGGGDPLIWTNDPVELSLRAKARDKFPWRIIAYRSTQPNLPGGVLWDAYKPRKILDQQREEYRLSRRGIDGYYQEHELQVTSEEGAVLGRKYIKYWNGYYVRENDQNFLVIDGEKKPVNIFGGSDPATETNTKSADFSVVLILAVDNDSNRYVLEYERHRGIPTIGITGGEGNIIGKKGVCDYIVALNDRYKLKHTVVENVGMTKSIFGAMNQYRTDHNRWDVVVIPEKPGNVQDKHDRIYSGLIGLFSAGKIFIRNNHYDLENEIVTFGSKMSFDDCMDALFYANKGSHPPSLKYDLKTKEYAPRVRKARSWML